MSNEGGSVKRTITLDAPELEATRGVRYKPGGESAPETSGSRQAPESGAPGHLARLAAEAEALHSFLELPLRNLGFDDFAREILMVFFRALPSEAASLLEVNHEEDHLFFRSALGHASANLGHFQIPMGSGIVGEVIRGGQPLALGKDLPGDSRFLKSVQDSVGFEAKNLVALPLVIRGRVFGVIELLNRVGGDRYTEQDVEFLMRLCRGASASIETRLVLGHLSGAGRQQAEQAA